jgi:hypothetical protein
LGFSKEGNEQKEDKIGIDLRLELEIAGKIFRGDLSRAIFKLKRGVERVIDLFHERDERADIVIAQSSTRIVSLELFDQPPGIINTDVKAIVGCAQKCAGKLTQFVGGFASQDRQLPAAAPINQTILEIDPDLRVSALEKSLDLTEERLVHKTSDGRASSSR